MRLLIGPKNSAHEILRESAAAFPVERGRIVVAWARISGVALLRDALAERMANLELVVGLSMGGTSAEALAYLQALCAKVYVFHKHPRQTFHPKIYCMDSGEDPPRRASVLVGSSNLTGGGLYSNYEGNLAVELNPSIELSDAELYRSVVSEFGEIVDSEFCTILAGTDHIRALLQDGFVKTEKKLRKKAAEDAAAGPRLGKKTGFFSSPPPALPQVALPPLAVEFDEEEGPAGDLEVGVGALEPPAEPETKAPVADGRFFVRTLTPNDVNKLHGAAGTFEPDLAVTVRDADPHFWGWQDRFASMDRGDGARLEWAASARLITTRTGPIGIRVDFVQWFRPARPAHAAEHRLRIGPISQLRHAVPNGFDANGLVVIERCDGHPEDFIVRFVASNEPAHADYARYITEARPRHRFGYATAVGEE